ncbi:MAG: hypothetical protein EOL88_14615 [Bacteroidia bacterium]|nr:hypothetical protein [Bacteroidia bacterium]
MNATLVREYETHLDAKKRITIRGAECEYYAVKTFSDGHVLLEPRVLVPPDAVSKKTLKMMDEAAKNFKQGKVSESIALDRYL